MNNIKIVIMLYYQSNLISEYYCRSGVTFIADSIKKATDITFRNSNGYDPKLDDLNDFLINNTIDEIDVICDDKKIINMKNITSTPYRFLPYKAGYELQMHEILSFKKIEKNI